MRNRFLTRAIAALAIFAAALLPASPAQASWSSERPREGASTWVPRYVEFNSYRDTAPNPDVGVLQFAFIWHQSQHMMETEGTAQTFEINAEIPCSWVDVDSGSFTSTEGYVPSKWSTNIPNAARPYEDTILIDNCLDDGVIRWGFGVLNAHLLVPGTMYTVQLGMLAAPYSNWTQSNITLKLQTGITLDTDIPWYDDSDCEWTQGQTDQWNDPTVSGIQLRHQAGYCSWPEWTHTLVSSAHGQLKTGQYKSFWANKLVNQGFEEPGTGPQNPANGWTVYGGQGTRYCNDPMPAFDGSCFVQFNGNVPAVSQIVPDYHLTSGGHITAETAVRCRTTGGCLIGLQVESMGGPSAYEYAAMAFQSIPNDGQWYLCRQDYNHVTEGRANSRLLGAHTSYRLYVWNYWAGNLDVDYAFLGAKTFYSQPGNTGPGHIPGDSDGAGCSVVTN